MMDWTSLPGPVHHLASRALKLPDLPSQTEDGRIGSTRNDSNSTGTLGTTGNLINVNPDAEAGSLGSLATTFVPILIFSAICFGIFLTFRRHCPRVYAPRTIPLLRTPENPSPQLPNGWFNWIKPFLAIDDTYILNNCTLDSFLFLRFLRVLSTICLVGGCIAWPILLPVNGTGGGESSQLDRLTIGNIKMASKYYAHVVVAWCFFGFVLFMVCRECIYYINLRQAYLLSPNYSQRLSSRTVLFTCIPKPYVDEAKLRKLFGDSAKNIWIPKDISDLQGLMQDREEAAEKLEQAEIRLIRLANMARNKFLKKQAVAAKSSSALPQPPSSTEGGAEAGVNSGCAKSPAPSSAVPDEKDTEKGQVESTISFAERQLSVLDSLTTLNSPTEKPVDPEYTHPYGLDPSLPDVRGSVASLWIPAEARPHHRPLRNFVRRVDTIRWMRARLKVLNRDIWKLRRKYKAGDGTPLNAAFIEFDSQTSAQLAFQILPHHQPLHMSPRYIGLRPDEVIWSSLRIRWWEQIMRDFFMMAVVAAAVIFWSIPSVFVGTISQLKNLVEMVFFLEFILKMPTVILSVIQGLLPALALSWLMSIVPWLLRGCARVAGVPSHALVELYVQHAYFAFQVVQVFLITTLSSAVSAALAKVLKDPMSIPDLLSENLPKASNFYLSYILVQCLGAGATLMANFSELLRHQLFAKTTVNPRKGYRRWRKLKEVHWGADYPRFTNLGVIALSYTCIAPLILIFAGLGMFFIMWCYRYCIIYVFDSRYDTKGLFYPRALMQLLFGLYLAELCLIGLFALQKGIGPLMLMLVFFIFTALVHTSLSRALSPLLYNLPRTLALEKDTGEQIAAEETPEESTGILPPLQSSGGLAADYYNTDVQMGTNEDSTVPPTTGGLADDYYNMDDDFRDESHVKPHHDLDTDMQMRGIEGRSSLKYAIRDWTKAAIKGRFNKDQDSGLTRILRQIKIMITPDPTREANVIMKFFHPEVYQDYRTLKPRVNPEPVDPKLPDDYVKRAYWPPEMWEPAPKLWIPKDEARVSRQEVAHTKDSIFISDEGCWLNDKARIECDFEASPLHEPRILY
ncbi:hypothetical protein QBC38DRAFT_501090 [Podospora fimiseda]|uniref:Phosphate metabolism protein n=1 Tax=Podospora fimiseda TaxID=252190 RepID=A0AAN7GW64_9PEZI|nr:hypothetical protein QBC38DRAFT_501090 [Podospora fimiseda]